MIDKTSIEETLRQLGGDADTVAASLRERGVTGLRRNAECCPIAVLLCQTDMDDEFDWIEVDLDNIRLHRRDADPYESVWIDPVPDAVGWFIARFDAGAYPDLATQEARLR